GLETGFGHFGSDKPGSKRVAPNLVLGSETGDHLTERNQPGLAGSVVGSPWPAVLAAHRTNIDDATATTTQSRQCLLCTDERPLEIHCQNRVPVFVGDLVKIGWLVDAGVINED